MFELIIFIVSFVCSSINSFVISKENISHFKFQTKVSDEKKKSFRREKVNKWREAGNKWMKWDCEALLLRSRSCEQINGILGEFSYQLRRKVITTWSLNLYCEFLRFSVNRSSWKPCNEWRVEMNSRQVCAQNNSLTGIVTWSPQTQSISLLLTNSSTILSMNWNLWL